MKRAPAIFTVLLCLLLCLSAVLPCLAADAPPYRGIDVSRWQGNIDWARVKAADIDFAILRCFANRKDTTFETNYAAATARGIDVGAYVYMYATTESAAVAEAQNVLNALSGKALQLPVFLDVEDEDVLALDLQTLRTLMLTELRLFAAAGYSAGIYTSQSRTGLYQNDPAFAGYDRWVAKWSCYATDKNKKTFTFENQDPAQNHPDCDIWQFSNGGDGSVFGMSSTYVDLDYCYKDYLKAAETPPPEQAHIHAFRMEATQATCTEPGWLLKTCTECGAQERQEYAPAHGHSAPDASGRCSFCGAVLTEAPQGVSANDRCPLCGERHTGLLGFFLLVLHTFLAFFR